MVTCFTLTLDKLQANVHKYNVQSVCTVGSHITYKVYVEAILNTKIVKML